MDFTQTTYKNLLVTLKSKDYSFLSFADYLHSANHTFNHSNHSVLLLRHDVDRLLLNSLKLAQLEHSLGIKGTYNFHMVPESQDVEIMKKIIKLGIVSW